MFKIGDHIEAKRDHEQMFRTASIFWKEQQELEQQELEEQMFKIGDHVERRSRPFRRGTVVGLVRNRIYVCLDPDSRFNIAGNADSFSIVHQNWRLCKTDTVSGPAALEYYMSITGGEP